MHPIPNPLRAGHHALLELVEHAGFLPEDGGVVAAALASASALSGEASAAALDLQGRLLALRARADVRVPQFGTLRDFARRKIDADRIESLREQAGGRPGTAFEARVSAAESTPDYRGHYLLTAADHYAAHAIGMLSGFGLAPSSALDAPDRELPFLGLLTCGPDIVAASDADERFALVVDVSARGIAFDFAVCVVEDGQSRVTFGDRRDLSGLVGGLPCAPSVYGVVPAIISLEAEEAALEAVSEALDDLGDKYSLAVPAHYEPLDAVSRGVAAVSVDGGRLSVHVEEWAAKAMGWQRGDRVSVAVTADGARVLVHLDKEGGVLSDSERAGWLAPDRDWPCPRPFLSASGTGFRPATALRLAAGLSIEPPDELHRDGGIPSVEVEPRPVERPSRFRNWSRPAMWTGGVAAFVWLLFAAAPPV